MSADPSDLTNLIRSVGPSPCDHCPTRRRCAADSIACRRFSAWAHDGRDRPDLPREPTRSTFVRLYGDEP